MHVGHLISGVGHASLIGWLLVGGSFAPTPEPFEVTEVAVISGAEFAAMMSGTQSPDMTTEVAMPGPPVDDAAPGATPAPTPEPQAPPPPEVAEAPPPDTQPDVSQLQPPDPADVQEDAPEIAPPPQEQVVLAPQISDRPSPRPVPRVAPEPVAQPNRDAQVDDVVREEATPQEQSPTPTPEQRETAPEEATTQIVTEATEKPSAAPVSSMRPKTRPNRPAPPAEQPQQPQTARPSSTRDAVNDALAQALGSGDNSDTPAPSGPPMTAGEKETLRVGVQKCWNVGSLSSDALRTTVVVAVSMSEDARPQSNTIRMLSYSGGSEASAKQAFEAARRAIIRCGASGYDLPADKYAHWREIEMTFNPEKMRIK